ncbi:MAG: InlB B-repeat-containing protein, partial [Treponema sp.]|nr:InlB B-repeat-containing protein [Treponema sp.]
MKKFHLRLALAVSAIFFAFTACHNDLPAPNNEQNQNESTSPTDDSTQKEEKFFEVKFESEHGTVPKEISVKENTSLTEEDLPYLTADYYDFLGWYDGETKVEAGYIVKSSVTLTAKWEENSLPLVLWNSRDEENNIVWNEDYNTSTLEPTGSYIQGIQLFDYKDRNNSLEITNPPLLEASNLPFCFSDDIVYFVKDDYFIVGYKKDGTGFKEVFTKDILALYN